MTSSDRGAPAKTTNSSDAIEPSWLTRQIVLALLAGERVDRPQACDDIELNQLGLESDASLIWMRDHNDSIDESLLRQKLNTKARRLWSNVKLVPLVASTNSALMDVGSDAVSKLLVTEYQFGGRGRRGKRWLSPIGRNLCFSLGVEVAGSADRLQGLSLVVGLAIADALVSAGISDVKLKWPNDLIVMKGERSYAKLGGILVELQILAKSCVVVIGVGLNHGGASASRQALDVALADLAELSPRLGRTDCLGRVVNALGDYLDNFLESGFAPMKSAWESLHAFQGRQVRILSGEQSDTLVATGRAVGVTDFGKLMLQLEDGDVVEVDAGEVSLRPKEAFASDALPGEI